MPITEAEGGSPPDTIVTDRLVLRPLAAGDAEAITSFVGDWHVARYTASIPHPFERSDADEWIANVAEARATGGDLNFAITDRTDGRLLGSIGLHLNIDEKCATLGFWLGRPYWNQGLMTEAVHAVLRLAFDGLSLDTVRAPAVPENAASIRVQEKAGMSYVGRETEPAPARGGDHEVVVRAISREAWRG